MGLTLFDGKICMVNTLLGIKKTMTSTYDSRGRRVGATILEIGPNFITQINPNSVQLGYGTKKSVRKPQIGHAKKAGLEIPIRWFREVRGVGEELKPGQNITLDQVFSIGDAVKITGTSKGKGFQGGVRRHGFHGGPKTHGQSDRHRAPGAIGSGTTPGRVYKGKKMAGHMGNATVSVKGLEVVGIDKEKNLLTIKGAVPGPNSGLVMVAKLGRIKGYTPPPEEKAEESKESEAAEAQANTSGVKPEVQTEVNTPEVSQEGEKENASS